MSLYTVTIDGEKLRVETDSYGAIVSAEKGLRKYVTKFFPAVADGLEAGGATVRRERSDIDCTQAANAWRFGQ